MKGRRTAGGALVVLLAALALSASTVAASEARTATFLEYGCLPDGSATMSSAAPGVKGGSCCNGLYCPYANAVCCPGSTHCCPSGLECLPTGPGVLPQCGTAASYNAAPLPQQIDPSACATNQDRCAPPNGTDPSDVVPVMYIGNNVAATVPRGTLGGNGEVVMAPKRHRHHKKHQSKLGDVKSTSFEVRLVLQVNNLLYPYLKNHMDQIGDMLREDLARNENIAEESVNVTSAVPLRSRTPGTESDETKLATSRAAAKAKELAAASAAAAQAAKQKPASFVETEARYNPISGVEFAITIYCTSGKAAHELGRHLYSAVKGNLLQLRSLEGLPDEARGNFARGFDVLRSSRVAVNGKEVSDVDGIKVAQIAHEKVQPVLRKVKKMKADLEGILKSIKESHAMDMAQMKKRVKEVNRKFAKSKQRALIRELELQKAAEGVVDPKLQAKISALNAPKSPPPTFLQVGVPFQLTLAQKPNLVVPYGGTFRQPQVVRVNDICYLSGKMKVVKIDGSTLTSLPEGCFPTQTRVFDTHVGDEDATAMIRVEGPGQVHWAAGATKSDYISLDGIQFPATQAIKELTLNATWMPVGSGFAKPGYVKDGSLCLVGGLVQLTTSDMGSWNERIAVLPAECRPDKRLVFQVNQAGNSLRVDVLPSGDIVNIGGSRTLPWISLDGIYFFTSGSTVPLTLGATYDVFADASYRTPSFYVQQSPQGNSCTLGGLIKLSQSGNNIKFLSNLPSTCRPSKDLTFHVNRATSSARITVGANGDITWENSMADGAQWLSLEGIHFLLTPKQGWEK